MFVFWATQIKTNVTDGVRATFNQLNIYITFDLIAVIIYIFLIIYYWFLYVCVCLCLVSVHYEHFCIKNTKKHIQIAFVSRSIYRIYINTKHMRAN